MALTSAVAHAAAAVAAAGAGKKAAQVQLQAELNSDDDWNKFILRDGLLGKSVIFINGGLVMPCRGTRADDDDVEGLATRPRRESANQFCHSFLFIKKFSELKCKIIKKLK